MARLDLHRLPGDDRDGYIFDVQAELLSYLATRVVVPLLPISTAPKPITDLNPIFDIDGKPYVLITQALASIPARELKRPVGSLTPHYDDITRALDILLIGF